VVGKKVLQRQIRRHGFFPVFLDAVRELGGVVVHGTREYVLDFEDENSVTATAAGGILERDGGDLEHEGFEADIAGSQACLEMRCNLVEIEIAKVRYYLMFREWGEGLVDSGK
jgi:hypothetical protein